MRAGLALFFLHPLAKSQWLAITLAPTVLPPLLLGRWWMGRETQPVPAGPPVVVEVRGDVRHPGVFLLQAPVAVMHAVQAAGGSLCGIETDTTTPLDQRPVYTGQRLQVVCSEQGPIKVEIEAMDAAARLTLGLKLNLNTAAAADLALVPGMRPRWAEAIVERRQRKAWNELSELQEIPGIGPHTV